MKITYTFWHRAKHVTVEAESHHEAKIAFQQRWGYWPEDAINVEEAPVIDWNL